MSEDIVIQNSSPTLAGIKTGSLFTCEYSSRESIDEDILEWNNRFKKKELQIVVLKYSRRALIYIFRPLRLIKDLAHPKAIQILTSRGYDIHNIYSCIHRLQERFALKKDFPHEVGLFLGYPPEDVEGFIKYSGKNCKSFGCWKVYGNTEAAHQCFERFKKCTACYCERYGRGCSLDALVVSQTKEIK